MKLAQQIADEIRKRAGGDVRVIDDSRMLDAYRLTWLYNCPCGEISGYSTIVPDCRPVHSAGFVRMYVETALEVMRRHVRSEGNEPSF